MRRILGLGLVCVGLAGQRALAQRVQGVILDSASHHPIAGAVVTSIDQRDQALARATTDAHGEFHLAVTTVERLRVLHIGFQPRTVSLNPSPTAAIEIFMVRLPALLETVDVRDARVCRDATGAAGTSALRLWEQARAGLLATVVANESQPAHATLRTYERWLEVRTDRVLYQTATTKVGQTTRPFVTAAAPAILVRDGFARRDSSGTTFFAPDAEALLDESFAATHCFHVVRDHDRPDQIGLAFDPAGDRDALTDVSGTLWLRSSEPALEVLEFHFTGNEGRSAGAHGSMHFTTLANGVTFIDQWSVSMSVPSGATRQADRLTNGMRVNRDPTTAAQASQSSAPDVKVSGGGVVDASWTDGSRWAASLATISGRVTEQGSGRAISGGVVSLVGTSDSASVDSSGGFSIDRVLPGTYRVEWADTAFAQFASPRRDVRDLRVAAGKVSPLRLELPPRDRILGEICKPEHPASGSATLLGRTAGLPTGTAIVSWTRFDIAGSTATTAKGPNDTVTADGSFLLCGVPADRPVRIGLSDRTHRIADTTLVLGGNAISRLAWRVTTTASNLLSSTGILEGRVRDTNGSGLGGVDVWFPGLSILLRTDSAGRFAAADLPSGALLMQFRRLGYTVLRDTVTVRASVRAQRDYVLERQAVILDTTRTVADQAKYISPGLRGFEDRRQHETGYFVSGPELRKNENRRLGDLLTSALPGVVLRSDQGGAMLLLKSPRCAHGGPPQVYLDGVPLAPRTASAGGDPIRNRVRPDDVPFDLSDFNVSELAGVEWYPDGDVVPVGFAHTSGRCGALLLWTRER